jgi:hypothetical protein
MHPLGCISGAENLAAINRFSLNLFTPNQCLLLFTYMDLPVLSKPNQRSQWRVQRRADAP